MSRDGANVTRNPWFTGTRKVTELSDVMAWQGKLLRVDLSTGVCQGERLNMDRVDKYLGLRGLGTSYLAAEVDPRVDPLSPDNKLIFATGPLTGTSVPTGGRFGVITKGALTGAVACSNSGGHFGAELKFAGWDMVILEGRAPEPVYLWIENDFAELLPAADFIWGESFWRAEERLRSRHGDSIKVAGIGRAGEESVLFACVMNDRDRAAGRSGVGAVMGSKNTKAIAVRGTRGVKLADHIAYVAAVNAATEKIANSGHSHGLASFGTNTMMNVTNHFGSLPTRNCREVQFAGADSISAEAMRRTPGPGRRANLLTNKACFACTIGCGRVSRIQPDHFTLRNGERYRQPNGGLEYESAYSLGAMVGVDDLDAATFANFVCNEQGMDTISFGVTLSAAMELYETGVISCDQTDGVPLEFGSADALTTMVQLTATGTGFGKDLGLGARRLCEKYGRPDLAMTVKGQEFPGYDPRAMQGMGLAYATSNRGACHLRANPFSSDFQTPEIREKAKIVKETQDDNSVIDCIGICSFSTSELSIEDIASLLDAVCESVWTADKLRAIGERVWNLERVFNLNAGFTAADDTLPKRMFAEATKGGANTGAVSQLKAMLPEYYERRGWSEDGVPTAETLGLISM